MPGYSYDCRIARGPVAVLVEKVHEETGKKEWALKEKSGPQVLKWFGASKPSDKAVAKEEARIQYFKHKRAVWDRHAFMWRYAYRGILPVPKQISEAMGGHEYVRSRLPGGDYYFLERSAGGLGGLGIGWDGDERRGNTVEITKFGPDNHRMTFFWTAYETAEYEPADDDGWGPDTDLIKTPVKVYKGIADKDLVPTFTRQTGIRL